MNFDANYRNHPDYRKAKHDVNILVLAGKVHYGMARFEMLKDGAASIIRTLPSGIFTVEEEFWGACDLAHQMLKLENE